MQVQHLAGVTACRLHGIRRIAFAAQRVVVDQDSDACPAVDWVQLEKVERPDGDAAEGFDDEPLLAGLKDVELLFLNEPFERVARKGGQRAADAPYRRVVLPSVHQVDVARFQGSQPRCPAFEVHQMPMILLRISIATPQALAFSVIFDTRNLVSL